jgi:hypothetical protein
MSANAEKIFHSPSVRVSAIRNSENGGRWSLAFNVANTEARMTNGATILNIYREQDVHSAQHKHEGKEKHGQDLPIGPPWKTD